MSEFDDPFVSQFQKAVKKMEEQMHKQRVNEERLERLMKQSPLDDLIKTMLERMSENERKGRAFLERMEAGTV